MCSGTVVTKYADGSSSTAYAKTEAEIAAEEKLRVCARLKAESLGVWCPDGRTSFDRGESSCVKAAESACR